MRGFSLFAVMASGLLGMGVGCGGDCCGSDLGNWEDTGNPQWDIVEPDGVEQPAPEGRVLIAEYGWGGQYNLDANVTVDFFDGPMRMDAFAAYSPLMYDVAARQGDCVLYVASDAACEPACDWDKVCVAGNRCLKAPSRISGGHVTVSAGSASVSADPTQDEYMLNWYYLDTVKAELVNHFNDMHAVAVGDADGFGAFDLEMKGVDSIVFHLSEDSTITLVDGRSSGISWDITPESAEGAYVDMVINNGWHGAPPESVLYCRVDAADGGLSIPKDIVLAMPQMGGPALMGHGSHIGLSRTVTAEVDGKTIEFTVTRRHGLNVLHNAPEW